MRHRLDRTIGLIVLLTAVTSCMHSSTPNDTRNRQIQNSVYYWKTTFAIDSAEQFFLKRHRIGRIYLRMFDVAIEQNYQTGVADIVPIATTRFDSSVPDGVEIVPVTYITLDALRAMAGREKEFASLIVERLTAMSSYNECGKINEMQLDCDWTSSSKGSYSILCQAVKDSLQQKGIALSVTVRLHQLRESPPPADRGVLMLYNTGELKKWNTRNSILDIDDVKPYMTTRKYPLPLSYAYPTFGWGVKFEGKKFVSIVAENDTASSLDTQIRSERPTTAEILAIKNLVEEKLGKPSGGNILYHLDYSQLKNYSHDEIDKILDR